MLKLKNAIASAAAAALLVAGVAVAQMPSLGGPAPAGATGGMQTVVNAEKGYSIGYPSGWSLISDSGFDYMFAAGDGSALCAANAGAAPKIAGLSNDQIKAALSEPLGEEFWTNTFFSGMANLKYLHTGADPNHPGGWPVQTVEATADITVDGKAIPSTFAGIQSFKSATQYQVVCFTPTPNYENAKPAFNQVLQSFKITKP